jgi:hypothetical protein
MLPNPYLILIAAAVFLAAVAGSFFEGRHYEVLAYEAQASAAKDVVIEKVQASERIGQTIEARAIDQVAQVQTLTQIETVEVPKYVTVQANARCVVPVGFVRLFDAAAAGLPPVPDAPSVLDGAAAGIDLATVGTVAVTDFGAANENAARMKALQDWISTQQKLGS